MMIHFWENAFQAKNHFPLYLEGQTQHTLRSSGMPMTMEQVSKLRFLVHAKMNFCVDIKLYDNATTCKEGTFLDLVCV